MEQIMKYLTYRNCGYAAAVGCLLFLIGIGFSFIGELYNIISYPRYWDDHVLQLLVDIVRFGMEALCMLAMGAFFFMVGYRHRND